jgi:hypothetical protein
MLLSSGGIHTIDSASVREYQRDGEKGYHVRNLQDAVEETFASGRLFNEQGLPWATVKPQPVPIPLDHAVSLGQPS